MPGITDRTTKTPLLKLKQLNHNDVEDFRDRFRDLTGRHDLGPLLAEHAKKGGHFHMHDPADRALLQPKS